MFYKILFFVFLLPTFGDFLQISRESSDAGSSEVFPFAECPPYNPNVEVFIPHEYNCTLYYRCTASGPVLQECWPPGTHWSVRTNRCEWASEANCTLSGVPPTTTTATTTTTVTTTTSTTTTTRGPFPPGECPPFNPNDPVYVGHEYNCTLYYSCEATGPVLQECWPPGTHWSIERERCEWAEEANCNLTPPPTTPTTTAVTTPTTTTTRTTPTTTMTTTTPTTTTTLTTTTTPLPPPQNQCPDVDNPNEVVFLPDEDDCASYYVCFNGDMIHRTCHAPFLWDQQNSWCDFPENVICPSLCPGRDDPDNPVYIPHESDCSYYYLCFNGTRLLRRCSDGLIWDRENKWCNFANETFCPDVFEEYVVEDSIEIISRSKRSLDFEDDDDDDDDGVWDARCPAWNDPNFTVHLPHEEFCDRFYKCSNGRIFLIFCPPNLHFSVEHDRCEWPSVAGCDPNNLPPLQTTTAGPLPPPGGGQCPNIDDPRQPVFLPDEDDCASYYVCFNGDKIHRSCHPPFLWDQRNLWCDFPENVICPSFCPAVDDPENPVFFPHEYSCGHYYLCFNGTRLLRNCSEGLIWDRDNEWCNFENETVCDLGDFSEYSLNEILDADLTILEVLQAIPNSNVESDGLVFDERCPGPDDDDPLNPVHLPHESDCGKFYKCNHGYLILYVCAPGTHWSVDHDRCEWPHLANCDPNQLPPLQTTPAGGQGTTTTEMAVTTTSTSTSSSTTTFSTSTSTVSTTLNPSLRCPAVDDPRVLVFLPHETNCQLYYLCSNGTAMPRSCHAHLQWDQTLNWCDFPQRVNC